MINGRTISLRAIVPGDYAALYALAVSDQITSWRNMARTIAPEQFQAFLWDGVYSQRAIVANTDASQPVGLVSVFNEDAVNQVGYLSVVVDPEAAPHTAGGEAAALWLRHMFRTTPFRKIYAETCELALPRVADGVAIPGGCEEGRLRDHVLRGGVAHDLVVIAFHREVFLKEAAAILQFIDGHTRLLDRTQRDGSVTWREFLQTFAASCPYVAESRLAADEIDGGTNFAADFGLDSIGLLEVVTWAEDEYRCAIDDSALAQLATVQDLYDVLEMANLAAGI